EEEQQVRISSSEIGNTWPRPPFPGFQRFVPPLSGYCLVSSTALTETSPAAAVSPLGLLVTCVRRRPQLPLPAAWPRLSGQQRHFLPGRESLSCGHYQSFRQSNQGRR